MGTTFKNHPAGLGVYFNGLFVAMIYKQDKPRDGFKAGHYGLAYNNGRYERFETQREAKDSARKIMAKKDITGRIVLY